jgi:hypothetical protein
MLSQIRPAIVMIVLLSALGLRKNSEFSSQP